MSMTGDRPSGKTTQISPQFAGCGCFGCSSLIFLAGCVVLLVIVWGFLLPDWRVNYRYLASSCVVLDRKLETQTFDLPGERGQGIKKEESYKPAIKIRYDASGRKIETWAYDGTRIYSPDRAVQQALVDSFQVGSTYPCWYDPDRPDQAVLVRGHSWGAYISLILPIGFWIVGGVGVLIAWKMLSPRPSQDAASGYPQQFPAVPSFIQTLQRAIVPGAVIDPAQFGDPVALKTEWSNMKGRGGNLQTHKFVEVDPDRLEFRATLQAILFALMFLVAGAGVFILALKTIVTAMLAGRVDFSMSGALPVGFLFAAVGVYLLYSFKTPIVFDRRRGLFWKGWQAPDEMSDLNALKSAKHLRAIHALQLVSYYAGRNSSYELNLVLASGDRLHIVTYGAGGRNRIRADTAVLAQFLGKPVWDAL